MKFCSVGAVTIINLSCECNTAKNCKISVAKTLNYSNQKMHLESKILNVTPMHISHITIVIYIILIY